MSWMNLCGKGLIIVIWSELVLEGFQCLFELVKSLSVSSEKSVKTLKAPLAHGKRYPEKVRDWVFTQVLFFPDHSAIAGLFKKEFSGIHQLVLTKAVPPSESPNSNTSQSSSVAQNFFSASYNTSQEEKINLSTQSDSASVEAPNDHGLSPGASPAEGCLGDSKDSSSHENRGGDLPVKSRGALEEMVRCLDGAVCSIDVCVMLLTCNILTAPLLRAKERGVRVRVLLDQSMATVDGSSLPHLRQYNIPVRLLPRNNSNDIINKNDDEFQSIPKDINDKIMCSVGNKVLQRILDSKQELINNIGGGKRAGVAFSASSGLMHHKFAVIDARGKCVQMSGKERHVRKDGRIMVPNEESTNHSEPDQKGSNHSDPDEEGSYHSDPDQEGTNHSEPDQEGSNHSDPDEEGSYHSDPDQLEKSKTGDGSRNGLGNIGPIVITGSFNWTWSAVTTNNENVILSNRPELVTPFSEQFEKMWRQAW